MFNCNFGVDLCLIGHLEEGYLLEFGLESNFTHSSIVMALHGYQDSPTMVCGETSLQKYH